MAKEKKLLRWSRGEQEANWAAFVVGQSVFHPLELQPPEVNIYIPSPGLPAYGMLLLLVPHSFSPEIFDAKSQWP